MMNKKAHTAMETVINYGWVVIVAVLFVSILYYLGIFNPSCPPTFQMAAGAFSIVDQKFVGSNAEIEDAQNLFYIILRNKLPYAIKIEEITIKNKDVICGSFIFPPGFIMEKGKVSNVLQGNLEDEYCFGKVKSCYKYETEIKYTDSRTGLDHVATGELSGGFEDVEDYWKLGNWFMTDYAENIVEDRAGEKINYCITETPPPDEEMEYTEMPEEIITWDLPEGCSPRGISQVGFENSCDYTQTTLAKGWIHTTMHVDNLFSESKLYLGGNARYYDNIASEWRNDGICMNDNLYFYVNGELKYWGGTTGVMVGNYNTWDEGDEVLRNCGNCEVVDASAWCIPAFDLTLSGFVFGEYNDIDILVEDYCKGGGQPHAGGMSPLTVRMVF